jgi:hypothetical protein
MILKRGSSALLIVGSAFTAIGISLISGAVHVLVHEGGPSTALMVLVAFGWLCLATVVAIALAYAGGVVSGHMRRHTGVVSVRTQAPRDGELSKTLTGSGAETEGGTDITIRSRWPAAFLFMSAAGLTATTIYLYSTGRTTLTGLGVGLVMACFNANWGKLALPRTRRQ